MRCVPPRREDAWQEGRTGTALDAGRLRGRCCVVIRVQAGDNATVAFRFARRPDDRTTAVDVGMFKYTVISKAGVSTTLNSDHSLHLSPDHKISAAMIQETIQQLEADLRAAQLSGDVTALGRLIDDALLFTGPDGSLATKADDLALHCSGAIRFSTHAPNDVQWQVVTPDVVVVAMRTRLAGFFHGQSFAGDYRYTRVWARRDDSWRIVAGHVSAVAIGTT